jgi:hypothetical protein
MKHKLGSLNMLQFVCSLLPAGATRQKKSGIGILTLSLLIMLTGQTVKAQMVVDCSGSDPTAYPTINAALANVPGPGTTISVSGTCTEDVAINGQLNLNLGAWWGSSATLRGHLTVNNSESIYLYGLNVSNAAGDGVTVYASRAVTFDTCTSDGNAGQGLNVSQNSDVNVVGPAAFDNNGSYGINIGGNSLVTFGTWNDQIIEVNNNKNTGIWMSQANFWTVGNTNIIGNASAVSGTQAVGIMEFGAARVQIGTCTGPNAIEQNQGGGINAQEASEVTLWTCYAGFRTAVANNGPVGISVGLGSQLTLADDVDITGHAGPGSGCLFEQRTTLFWHQRRVAQRRGWRSAKRRDPSGREFTGVDARRTNLVKHWRGNSSAVEFQRGFLRSDVCGKHRWNHQLRHERIHGERSAVARRHFWARSGLPDTAQSGTKVVRVNVHTESAGLHNPEETASAIQSVRNAEIAVIAPRVGNIVDFCFGLHYLPFSFE